MEERRDKPVVLVTGVCNPVGHRAAQALARDYRVVGFDAVVPVDLPTWGDFIECDLTDDDSVRQAAEDLREDVGDQVASVVHLDGYADFSGAPSPLYEALNMKGTRRLIRALTDFDVGQILFSSTILVMKPKPPGEIIDERSPIEGAWDYPWSKIEAERILRAGRGSAKVTILRFAGWYDERGRSPQLSRQMARIYERQLGSHLFPGDPNHGRPFIHVEDCASAILAAVEHRRELEPVEIFLVAEPEIVKYGDLQSRLGRLIHGRTGWRTYRVPKLAAKAGAWVKDALAQEKPIIRPSMIDFSDAHYPISIETVSARLGWAPEQRLSENLELMVEALKRDPQGFYEENGLGARPELPSGRRAA